MSLVPDTNEGKILFFQSKNTPWAANAVAIGTAAFKAAVRDMAVAGSDIIKQIRAKAATDGGGVYLLAQIPAPATPTPVPAPGTPTVFSATLNPDGSLKLKWKCANPAGAGGTTYQIARRSGATGEFVAIGVAGTRSFTDTAVPAGVASVTYGIVAVRSTA